MQEKVVKGFAHYTILGAAILLGMLTEGTTMAGTTIPATTITPATLKSSSTSPTVLVNTTAGLMSALKTATAGETISLAPGNYSNLSISGQHFTGVTITSQNPNSQAELSSFNVVNSSGITFSNLQFVTAGTANPYQFRVTGSQNITYSNDSFHGALNSNTADDTAGLYVAGSSNIAVTNSKFFDLSTGAAFSNNSNVTVTGNAFHDLSVDGIDNAQMTNVVISGNSFTNFHTTAGAHPDAIQFWTAGTTASSKDITISNNVVTRGDGSAVQGIFMGDELGNKPYQNVTIANNIIVGALYNGIAIGHVDGVHITGNIVAGYSDYQSKIYVGPGSTGVVLAQNAANTIGIAAGIVATLSGNTLTKAILPSASTTLARLLISNSPLGSSAISHTTSLTSALLQMSR